MYRSTLDLGQEIYDMHSEEVRSTVILKVIELQMKVRNPCKFGKLVRIWHVRCY